MGRQQMSGSVHGWTGVQVDGYIKDVCIYVDGQVAWQIADEWMGTWMDRCIGRWINSVYIYVSGEVDGQIGDGWMGTWFDRGIGRWID